MLRKLSISILVISLTLPSFSAEWIGASAPEPSQIQVLFDNPARTELEIKISGFFADWLKPDQPLLSLDGKNFDFIPSLTRLIAIPAYRDARLVILEQEFAEVDWQGTISPPEKMYDVGRPVVMRDLRTVPLTIYPLRINPSTGKTELLKRARLCLNYEGYSGLNNKVFTAPTSSAFQSLYRNSIVNYNSYDDPSYEVGKGTYLIIVPQEYTTVPAFDEFVEWKRMKGYQVAVHIMTTSDTSTTAIYNIIQDSYENADPPLEYVLLLADANQGSTVIPYYTVIKPGGGETDPTDHPYTLLEGDDYFSDVMLGRISVDYTSRVQIVLNKIVKYEKIPFTGLTNWYTSMLSVAGNYSDTGIFPITPVQAGWWIADYFLMHGYTTADTIFNWYPGEPPYPGTTEILNSINAGKSVVTYRGWADINGWQWPVFNISSLSSLINGWMLPVVCSFVCHTGYFSGNCFGEEFVRMGTVSSGGGAVAFFGPSDLHTDTNFNNSISTGWTEGFLQMGLRHFAVAAAYAKQTIYEGFPNERGNDQLVQFYFKVYNCLGDPEMEMWSGVPQSLTLDCPNSVPNGTSSLQVTVTHNGAPVANAYVTVIGGGELLEGRYTDASGSATLTFEPGSPDLTVSATKYGYIPQIKDISLTSTDYLGYLSSSLMNETHPDGYLNPGETAGLRITVKNFGITGQNNVTGTLTTSNPYITILDGNASFGNIVSNGSATGDFSLSVEADAPTASAVDFTLVLSSSVSNYQSKFSLLLDGIDLQIEEVSLPGGPINPGAQGDVEITLVNNGAFPASGVTAELSSFDEAVTILDGSANYGDIPSGQTVSNSDPLRIQIGEDAYEGRIIQLRLLTSPSVGAEKTLTFNITVGTPESDDPTGPDPYGYFAYDDTDVDYSSVPAFNWAELDPDYGGVGGAVPIFMQDDSSIQVDLPFNFKFYGETYNIVTICSNGWVSFADTWSEIFRNWDLPSPEGPPTLVAAFWDDLKDSTDTGWMHIYYWYDSAGDRFIVEWSRVLNCFLNAPQRIETFEVILYDPQSTHHGPTGDGDILVQLLQVNDIDETNNFCTIGIEDYYHTRGLEYIYAKDYANHPTSDSLRSNMAILFTTTPPDDYAGVNDNEGNVLSRFSLSPNYPNPFNPSTIINFELGRDEMVNLTIYDISGRVVRSLASGEFTAGMHIVEWDGNGDASNPLSSGIYFIQLKAGDFKATNKCVLIK